MNALELRDNAKQQLAEIKTIESGVEYLNKVKAIEVWAKAEKKDAELQNLVAEQKLRTQRILGGLIEKGFENKEFNTGGNPTLAVSAKVAKPTLNDNGISHYQSKTFRKIAELPEDLFEEQIRLVLEKNNNQTELTTARLLKVAKDYKKLEKRKELAERGSKKEIEIDFRLGDFEEVFADIKDGSVDCIITDPPYPLEFIECWSKLSRFAKRVLKPNGFCVAYSGQMHLPKVIKRMSEHLDYYWTFAVYHEGQTQIVSGVNLICRWKPVLIFQNGKKKINNTFQDYFISEQREKTGHDWQQSISGVGYLIEMFTNPNDLILDPFAGSGTTIKSSKEKGRRIKAAEINKETYNIAKSLL